MAQVMTLKFENGNWEKDDDYEQREIYYFNPINLVEINYDEIYNKPISNSESEIFDEIGIIKNDIIETIKIVINKETTKDEIQDAKDCLDNLSRTDCNTGLVINEYETLNEIKNAKQEVENFKTKFAEKLKSVLGNINGIVVSYQQY
ncbi:hypothetical protein H8356DRAFT_1081222 [Neocallimastix lanati (nom. inval.)]|jgi:hypothetical protein|nr:hypothetical protein H8356DRAFT_1081222 [Neocallimastix sp. JGI-2020a]